MNSADVVAHKQEVSMRVDRVFFVIGAVLIVVGSLIGRWLNSGVAEAQQFLEKARGAPNATVGRLNLEQYKKWALRAGVRDHQVFAVDSAIGAFAKAEQTPAVDTSRGQAFTPLEAMALARIGQAAQAIAFTDALTKAWDLEDVHKAKPTPLAADLVTGLLPVYGWGIAVLAFGFMLWAWLNPKETPQQVVVNCPHKTDAEKAEPGEPEEEEEKKVEVTAEELVGAAS